MPLPLTCGDCTMCCKLLAVPEIEKPALKWCKHCSNPGGCGIYDTKPKSCTEFECIWLQTQKTPTPLPLELRPDKSRVVLSCWDKDHTEFIYAYMEKADKFRLGAKSAMGQLLRETAKISAIMFVINGKPDRLSGPKEIAEKMFAQHQELQSQLTEGKRV